jgi:hypothetical protein
MKTDPVWYDDLRVLFGPRFYEFWPTADQTFAEKINAITRFVIYATLILYLVRRESKIVLGGIAAVGVVAAVHVFSPKTEGFYADIGENEIFVDIAKPTPPVPKCERPRADNPFGNVLLTDYIDNPAKPGACDYEDVTDETKEAFNSRLYRNLDDVYEKKNSQRQFYTMPSTTIPNDTEAYREFVFGIKTNCKTNPKQCTGYN